MTRLNYKDLQTLISAIENLNSDFDPKSLRERALSAAIMVIEAESVAFTGFGYNGELSGLAWDSSESITPEEIEIFGHYMHEQPLLSAYLVERRTETLVITDLLAADKFECTNIYNEFYRRVGVRNQLVSPLAISEDLFVSCSANTSKKDFSVRNKQMSMLLAPHLINAIRNSLAYERLSSALETEECGVIAVNSNGKPIFVSEFARQLLGKYFAGEKRATNSLPETLQNWLIEIKSIIKTGDFNLPPAPLKIENKKGELTIRFMYNNKTREKTLLLEEKRFADPKVFEQLNLTRREAEIMFWITKGKSDELIAKLCGISKRTVHKHIENIYTKLGVETRTAAMMKAVEIL